jgi:large subunit ribosomal protein L25
MTETNLKATTGRPTGSAAARRLRSSGQIPGVVYGLGMTPTAVSVDRRELRAALSGDAGMNTILDLQVDGDTFPTLIKEVQRHPVRRNIEHIDFIQVDLNVEVVVSVPIHLTGEAKEVSDNKGLIDLVLNEIDVATTPRKIPNEIVFDVTEMTMDSTITVADLTFPAGVTPQPEPETVVVTVSVLRVGDDGEAGADEGESGGGAAASGDEAAAADSESSDGDESGN